MVPARFRALVLLATFASLRWGELAALRRRDVDLDGGLVRVAAAYNELSTGRFRGTPKTPPAVAAVLLPSSSFRSW